MSSRMVGGIVMCLIGAVWIAQGIGKLPGSYMTGRGEYAVLGAVVLAAGVAMIVWGVLRNRPKDS